MLLGQLENRVDNIEKLKSSASLRYEKMGALLYYAPLRNSPNSYLTIYRDGTVLSHDLPGNEIPNQQLTKSELDKLKIEYFAGQINQMPSNVCISGHGPVIFLLIDHYQKLNINNPPAALKAFLSRLDSMIESYIQSATYCISYGKQVAIKEWQYADILPLDQASNDSGNIYLNQNFERLLRIRPSPALFKEAEDYDRGQGFFYRYKDKIYAFTFPTCTGSYDGTWACFRAAELTYGIRQEYYWGYKEWPTDSGIRLSAVPKNGLDIPKEEYSRHRAFYTSLLSGSKSMYREGEYIYQGVQVNYH